ncbi:MAG: histidine phosphatase family protein [Lachnospiraceae bacterium]|nr:histidine phosphatase family protein [Lachnospiraceae bacterium]
MKNFYVLRHGQTTANTEHRLQGHTDTHLNETGREQARHAGRVLARLGIRPDRVIVSPLVRVWETAEEATGMPRDRFVIDPRIIEMGFGVLEMITDDEMTETFYREFHVETDHYHAPEGGESFYDVIGRIGDFLETMRSLPETGETVLVVSHGAAIHAMISYLNQDPITDFWKIHVGNCAILKVTLGAERALGEDRFEFIEEGFYPGR